MKYSAIERVKQIAQIKHRLIREVLHATETGPGIEISSMSDIPSGTGLGSSGAFTVGLLRALVPEASRPQLADLACKVDTGQQDQYAAVYGGVHAFDFAEKTLRPVGTQIDEYLQLFYTGVGRISEPVAVDPVAARIQAHEALLALEANDPEQFGRCLSDQWMSKLAAQPSEFHAQMDRVIIGAQELGAFGGKLIGAGGGGFLLFAGKVDPIPLGRMGLVEVPFRFEHAGTTLL